MGDGKPGNGEDGSAKPPTILKPGEAAPGSQRRVLLPPAPLRTRHRAGQERARKSYSRACGQTCRCACGLNPQ